MQRKLKKVELSDYHLELLMPAIEKSKWVILRNAFNYSADDLETVEGLILDLDNLKINLNA